MDISTLATALIGAQVGQLQLAAAAKMIRMNAQAENSIAQLIDASQQNLNNLANVAAGIGTNIDISV
jgi:hypothetical protein